VNWAKFILAALSFAVLTTVGCTTLPQTRYYALSATELAPARTATELVLAIGPIDLPEYLRRPQIVTRVEGNRLIVDEFNRWGGSLEEEIDRVLAQNLGKLAGSQRIYSYPSRIVADIDYRISLYIRGFDGALGNTVTLDASWSIIDEQSANVVRTNQGRYQAAAVEGGYANYATALSGTLEQLSRDLAIDLAALNP